MKQELINRIIKALTDYVPVEKNKLNAILTLCLDGYEITEKSTAIVATNYVDKNKEIIKKFALSKIVEGCTKNTLRGYNSQLERFFLTVKKPYDAVTTDDIRFYIANKQFNDSASTTYVNNIRRYLNSFFSWAVREEYIEKNPIAKIPLIRGEKKKKSAFDELEIEKMRNGICDALDSALFEFMLSTGCRVGEVANVRLDDFIDKGSCLVHGKGRKDRIVYCNAKAQLAIQNHLKTRKYTSEYLFNGSKSDKPLIKSSIERRVRLIGERSGVDNVHPHRFRRTCATMALRRGMPLEQVSKMLGHEQLQTTQIYLDLNDEELLNMHKKYVV